MKVTKKRNWKHGFGVLLAAIISLSSVNKGNAFIAIPFTAPWASASGLNLALSTTFLGISGAGIVGGSIGLAGLNLVDTNSPMTKEKYQRWGGTFALMIVLGIIFLDKESVSFHFREIPENAHSAQRLKVSVEQIEVYNSEVAELNAIKSSLEETLGPISDPNLAVIKASEFWQNSFSNLSQETLIVLKSNTDRK